MKKAFSFIYLTVVLIIFVSLTSCLKDDDTVIKTELQTSSSFKMTDSLKVADADSSGPTADIYKRYNGKTYSVNSTDQVVFNLSQSATGLSFNFKDTSVKNLSPSFTITIKNTGYSSLLTSYNLADTNLIKVEQYQEFGGGLSAGAVDLKVITGILNISYNQALKTLSGEINNFKTIVGYYVPENISATERAANGILLVKGGSTRTVELEFNNVPAK